MNSTSSNHVDADQNKFAAMQKARMSSLVNKSSFSPEHVRRTDAMAVALEYCFPGLEILQNYRKTKSTVTVRIGPCDLRITELQNLENGWETQGVTKNITGQSIIYSIPKV